MNIQRLLLLMEREELDALVACSPESVRYLSGSFIITQRIIRDRIAAVVVTPKDPPVFLVCGIEEGLARSESWIEDIRTYFELAEDPIQVLADILREKDLDGKQIGIEYNYLTWAQVSKLRINYPKAYYFGCDDLLAELRLLKTHEEVKLLKLASLATRRALEDAFSYVKPGVTERDLQRVITNFLLQYEADSVEFMSLGAGSRGCLAHPLATDNRIAPGDVVKVDVGGLFSGYYSDLARTAVVGSPSNRQAGIYAKMIEIQKAIIAEMRPGIKASNIYALQKKLFEESDLPFNTPHIGHGIGIGLHENPMIAPYNNSVLQEGMVINLEPYCIDEDIAGYHIEDLLLITNHDPEVLSESDFNPEMPVIS